MQFILQKQEQSINKKSLSPIQIKYILNKLQYLFIFNGNIMQEENTKFE